MSILVCSFFFIFYLLDIPYSWPKIYTTYTIRRVRSEFIDYSWIEAFNIECNNQKTLSHPINIPFSYSFKTLYIYMIRSPGDDRHSFVVHKNHTHIYIYDTYTCIIRFGIRVYLMVVMLLIASLLLITMRP